MSSRFATVLGLAVLVPAALFAAATSFTPPPGPMATPEQLKALLATVPAPAAGEVVVNFEDDKADIGAPLVKWEEKGVTFALSGPLVRTPGGKPQVMFFPHLETMRKGILNAMPTDQGVPLKMTFPGSGASSVTLVLWGSTNVPVEIEAFDKDGKSLDKQTAVAPSRKAANEPTPFFTLTVKGSAIAYVHLSGPRNGEFAAADEVRFLPVK